MSSGWRGGVRRALGRERWGLGGIRSRFGEGEWSLKIHMELFLMGIVRARRPRACIGYKFA